MDKRVCIGLPGLNEGQCEGRGGMRMAVYLSSLPGSNSPGMVSVWPGV